MRVMVTGGAGFIGGHVAETLLAEGHQVAFIDDLSSGRAETAALLEKAGARFFQGDIRDAAFVQEAFSAFQPEAVSHQAAQTSVSVSVREPIRDAEINVIGGLNVLHAARDHGARRFVFASTGGALYGEVPEGKQAASSWPGRPASPYACSKLAFEGYLGAASDNGELDVRILRYANVYGERQDPHGEAGVVAIFCNRLIAGQSLQINAMVDKGDRGCVRDYIHVSDVVAANLAALTDDAAGIGGLVRRNVGTGIPADTQHLVDGLCAAAGASAESIEVTFAGPRAGDLQRSVHEPDTTLREPLPLDEGLARTYAWFAAQAG